MTGIISIVLGFTYLIALLNIPLASIGNPYAPLYFPATLGILMVLLGIILVLKNKKIDLSKYKNDNTLPMIFKTSIIIIIYTLLFNPLGYIFSTIIFMFMLLYLFNGKKNMKRTIIVSILFSVLIYVAFSKILGVYLPVMPFIYI